MKIWRVFLLLTGADIAEIEVPSKLEQLIIDIESEIDIEKRFDFSRSNSKEKQLSDLKKINNKLKLDLKAEKDKYHCFEKIIK